MFIGITFKDKRIPGRAKLHYQGTTITIDKPFKHIYIKRGAKATLYSKKGEKETEVTLFSVPYITLSVDKSKKSKKANQSLKEETNSQIAENKKLPKFFYGEWYQKDGTREYNGMLIRPDFMEHFYQACVYDKIEKEGNSYIITVRCDNGSTATYKIQKILKNKILVERPDGSISVMDKVDSPLIGIRISPEKLPKLLRKRWYTTDGKNSLVFDLTGDDLVFKGERYKIEEVMFLRANWGKQYRIIAKNSEGKAMMFYFKEWYDKYCRVGYNGKNGNLYKNDPAYPDHFKHSNRMVTITKGTRTSSVTYYRYEGYEKNTPLIEVRNDTLYLDPNDLIITVSAERLESVSGINYMGILLKSIKQPALKVYAEYSLINLNSVEVQNLTATLLDNSVLSINDHFSADTIRLNVNYSVISKTSPGKSEGSLVKGKIENFSDVTLPKAKQVELDIDSTSIVKY